MKTKYYAFNCPIHIKKYAERKFGVDKKGNITVTKITTFGEFISFGLRAIPYPVEKKWDKSKPFIRLKYFDETFANFLPHTCDSALLRYLDRLFREELISFVSGGHVADGDDYTKYVWKFLDRYGIVRDEDIEGETARKIYRDYLQKVLKTNQKFFSDSSVYSATCP